MKQLRGILEGKTDDRDRTAVELLREEREREEYRREKLLDSATDSEE